MAVHLPLLSLRASVPILRIFEQKAAKEAKNCIGVVAMQSPFGAENARKPSRHPHELKTEGNVCKGQDKHGGGFILVATSCTESSLPSDKRRGGGKSATKQHPTLKKISRVTSAISLPFVSSKKKKRTEISAPNH
ncbi:MAG: hypothetical protein LAT83_16230 [Kiritimatiellae bacterium]|nr:hypothetical protein [Kiritimatiellia bacterium]